MKRKSKTRKQHGKCPPSLGRQQKCVGSKSTMSLCPDPPTCDRTSDRDSHLEFLRSLDSEKKKHKGVTQGRCIGVLVKNSSGLLVRSQATGSYVELC